MSEQDLVQYIANSNPNTLVNDLRHDLATLSPEQRLTQFIQLFSLVSELGDRLDQSVNLAWKYFVDEQLWRPSFPTLGAFQEFINYDSTVLPVIDRAEGNARRAGKSRTALIHRWGAPIETLLPEDIRPPAYSRHLLAQLVRLSKACTIDRAIPLLREQSRLRRSAMRVGSSRFTPLTIADVQLALLNHNERRIQEEPEVNRGPRVTVPQPRQQPLALIETRAPAEFSGPMVLIETQAQVEGDDAAPDKDAASPGRPDAVNDAANVGPSRDANPRVQSEVANDGPCGVGHEAVPEHVVQACACPPTLRPQLELLQDKVDDDDSREVFLSYSMDEIRTFCRPHLRTFASSTVGLLTNVTNSVLYERLEELGDNYGDMPAFRAATPDWFLKAYRPAEDELGIYRYPRVECDGFDFDPAVIFQRFGGPFAWDIWQRDGTIVLGDAMGYLDAPEIKRIIDLEFDIYRYHYRAVPGRASMGFLRNMFYGLIQQLLRQDPVWYALTAAARADRNWRLISYPYVAKDVRGGESTAFLHLDLNVGQLVKSGKGKNAITSSVSLDEEGNEGCTVVVPGFHRHIDEWHKRRIERGEDSGGRTTNCNKQYRGEDRADWGQPVPSPCPAYGLRITRSEIIHGSTGSCDGRRRAIYAWLTGIGEDELSLDNPETLDWEEVAACHRDLEAPGRGVSGDRPSHSLPPFRFPGAIYMESSYALGDALLGRRKWTDEEAIKQRNMVLGDDDEVAGRFIEEARGRMVEKFLWAGSRLEEVERRAFGANSFFVARERDTEMAD